tara:strand:- start:97 stop:528 length:432 start_codon:yes stop_codon:yes gene_type:complete
MSSHQSTNPSFFEAIQFRSRWVGPIKSPPVTMIVLTYEDEIYSWSSPVHFLQMSSKLKLNEWTLQAEKSQLKFKISIQGASDQFVGTVLEDTDGSYLFSHLNLFSNISITVYRAGKLETRLSSHQCALEFTKREKVSTVAYSH